MNGTPHRYSTDSIEAMLAQRIADLAHHLAPRGRRLGHEWNARDAVAGSDCSSFLINLTTCKWAHFAADKRGSVAHPCLSLIAYLATGDDFGKAILWAKNWLGLTGQAPDPVRVAAADAKAQAARAAREVEDVAAAERRRRAAMRIWLEGAPVNGDDPASQYLRGRGIDLALFAEFPGAIRFHPAVRIATLTGEPHPAMVIAMHREGLPDGFGAVHGTYIKPREDGSGWDKAFGAASKKMLGAMAGAAMRLTRGASGKPLASAPAGEWVAIAEGPENALSAAIARPDLRMLCAGSLGNIGRVQLPEQIGGVFVIADNDRAGSAAETGLENACNALVDRGIDLKLIRAPRGFKDFNDALCGKEMVLA